MNFLNRNWPKIFLLASIAIFALNIASIVTNILGIITIIGINVINIYCTFFSFLTLSAELRQFNVFRKMVSFWLKYFIFLLFYKSRGVFYILYGLLTIGSGILTTVSGFLAIGLGVCMIITSLFVELPVYEDMKEMERQYEDKVQELEVPSGLAVSVGNTVDNVSAKLKRKKGKKAHLESNEEPAVRRNSDRSDRDSEEEESEEEDNSPPEERSDGYATYGRVSLITVPLQAPTFDYNNMTSAGSK